MLYLYSKEVKQADQGGTIMTTKFDRLEDKSGINEHMLNIINKATASYRTRNDDTLAILSDEAVRGVFDNMTEHRTRPRCFGFSGEIHVSVKSGYKHENSRKFKPFTGYVKRNELIDAMTYMKCFESDRDPSIELIQWEDHFYMMVNSANLIGGFRCLVEKEIVFEIFGIK